MLKEKKGHATLHAKNNITAAPTIDSSSIMRKLWSELFMSVCRNIDSYLLDAQWQLFGLSRGPVDLRLHETSWSTTKLFLLAT